MAAGTRVTPARSDELRRLIQPWQDKSFYYYNVLGEINYAAQFYSRMLSPLELFAAEIDEDGDIVRTDNAEAIAALERIQDPGGGRTGLLGQYGRLMFLVGEAILFVSEDEDGVEQWEMLSNDELRVLNGTYYRYKAPSLTAEEYLDVMESGTAPAGDSDNWTPMDQHHAVAYRLWQRHPQFSMLADSTMRGVQTICEELLLLELAVRARARSRASGNGILFIDDRISKAPPQAAPDEDPEEDEFMQDITEAITAPIEDEGAASSVVPLIVRVPNGDDRPMSDLVYHLQLTDPTQLYPETGLRMECVSRLAIGLDMPPEELKGLGDSNHWTAWMVDENTWKAHGQRKAQQLCDDLTASYFRPYLRDVMTEEEARKYLIGYDATAIINHPDRSKDAKDAYGDRVIGKRAYREAINFDEEDAPTKDELAEMIGIATRDSSLAWFGVPAPRGGTVETAPGVISAPGAEQELEGATIGAEVEAGPPEGGGNAQVVIGSAQQLARILGAADMALLRARELAGSRIVSYAKRDAECKRMAGEVRTGMVAATLGREKVRSLRTPSEAELVAGSRGLIKDALRVWGVDEKVADALADHIERHAARTLYDRNPAALPDTFASYVVGLLSAGG